MRIKIEGKQHSQHRNLVWLSRLRSTYRQPALAMILQSKTTENLKRIEKAFVDLVALLHLSAPQP